ncbi:MAG TPA: hypothetical protein VGF18_06215 [Candidatus Tumulicola sp.]
MVPDRPVTGLPGARRREENYNEVSRRPLSPQRRRFWTIFAIAAFLVMCAAIGLSQWWAYNVNVPHYKAAGHAGGDGRKSAP